MVKAAGPDLKRYMDKRLSLKLNGNRKVTGVLRGFDQFMNVTLDKTVEEVSATESNRIGMVRLRDLCDGAGEDGLNVFLCIVCGATTLDF
ncbi:Small nuclear ribonucleoprotein g, partial [Globisporangium splendens]